MIGDLCIATVSGQGAEGYRLALERLRELELAGRVSDARHGAWRAAPASAGSTCCSSRDLIDVRWLTGFTGQQRARRAAHCAGEGPGSS